MMSIAQSAMIVEYVLMQAWAAGIGTSLTNVTEGGLSKPSHLFGCICHCSSNLQKADMFRNRLFKLDGDPSSLCVIV